jgi:hypothetical protein
MNLIKNTHFFICLDLAQGDRLNLSSFIMLVETEFERVYMLNKSRMKFKELDVDISGALLHREICLLSEFCLNSDKVIESDKEKIMLNIEQRHTTFDAGLSFEEFFVLYEEERRVQTNIVFATGKFKELDEDRSGYLGGAELNEVVEWILDNGQVDIYTYIYIYVYVYLYMYLYIRIFMCT